MEHQRSEGGDSAAAQRPPSEDGDSYQLSYELIGHVIKVCSCGDGRIASTSWDNTGFSPYPEKNHFILSKTLKGHADFVEAIAWFPPNQQLAKGGIVSGGVDKVVILWDLTTGEIAQRMKGHREQVTGVAVAESRDIFSSSLDGTIRQWRKDRLIHCWEAHAKGVEALKQLPTGDLLTCSSDFTIKFWRGKTCLKTFQGHTDIVRGLAVLSEFIISASKDCSIKLWAENGEVLKEMIGHTSSVLFVDAHSSGLVASGGEDCFLKIWKDGLCIQSIELLDCIWDVKFLENGDIVTASGDGVVRIWTSHRDRIAEAIELEFFKFSLAERKKLGLGKLEDIEAFNFPDQDHVLAPPTVAPTTMAPTSTVAPTPTVAPPTTVVPTTIVPPTVAPPIVAPPTVPPTTVVAPTVMVGGEENRFQRSTIMNCLVFLSTVAVAFIASMLLVNFKEKSEEFKKMGLCVCCFPKLVLFACGHLIYMVSRYRHHNRYATVMLFIMGVPFSLMLLALLFFRFVQLGVMRQLGHHFLGVAISFWV